MTRRLITRALPVMGVLPIAASAKADTTQAFKGEFSSISCKLGNGVIDPVTGIASSTCSVRYGPRTTGEHVSTAGYGGDASHSGSSGTHELAAT